MIRLEFGSYTLTHQINPADYKMGCWLAAVASRPIAVSLFENI